MKKFLLLSVVTLIALLSSFCNSYAQKSVDKRLYFAYIQLPSHPLSVTKFDYIVYQNGDTPDGNEEEVIDYGMLKKTFEIDVDIYYDQMIKLDKQIYKIGTSKELSLVKKQLEMSLLDNQRTSKPTRTHLKYEDQMEFYAAEMKKYSARQDTLNNAGLNMFFKSQLSSVLKESAPVRPYLKRVSTSAPYRLPNAIISERLVLRGLERVYNDPTTTFFEISMAEFETKEEKKKTSEKEVLILEYRRVVGYKVLDGNNQILAEGMISGTDKWYKEVINLATTKKSDISKKRKALEKLSSENSLASTRSFLLSRYGYPIVNRSSRLSYAKGKKFDYENITKAYELALNVFKTSLKKENSDLSTLKTAIATWELELKESDFSNKKARISTSVSTGLYFNIVECSIWLNEFDKATNLLDELSKFELKSKVVRKIDSFRDFISKRKQRYEANNKVMAQN